MREFNNGIRTAMRATILGLIMFVGCGQELPFQKPPTHVDRGMSEQPKFKPQSENDFFADKASMREPVAGTISYDELRDNSVYYAGKDSSGNDVAKAPIATNMLVLTRGQERYNIYCSPCHGRIGDGQGIVVSRGYIPPPSYHSDRSREVPDGHIFDVISNGIRNMPSYGSQIPVSDRWNIVLYVRALQRSQNANINDVPEEMRQNIK